MRNARPKQSGRKLHYHNETSASGELIFMNTEPCYYKSVPGGARSKWDLMSGPPNSKSDTLNTRPLLFKFILIGNSLLTLYDFGTVSKSRVPDVIRSPLVSFR